jgi:8-oxo-dGTP pyrophosphatase MutT (NUDIX family)
MKHRIRAAAIIEKENKILLVKHVHPLTQFEWWVPPGGGVEPTDDSVVGCVIREVFEETGIQVKVDDSLLFVREFMDTENDTLNMELFFNATYLSGELTIENIYGHGDDEDYIKDVKWFTVEQLKEIRVFPKELEDNFAKRLQKSYLGRHY